MLDQNTNVSVYNAGDKFKFNVDAVSGTLHKSTRKSKFCVRDVDDDNCIFNDTRPHLTRNNDEEVVILQTMLTGNNKILVEYMTRKDYDEMFDGPLPDIIVRDMMNEISKNIKDYVSHEEGYDRLMDKDKEEDYAQKKWERSWMAEQLTRAVVQNVCKYLEDRHIATFDFSNDACVYSNTVL